MWDTRICWEAYAISTRAETDSAGYALRARDAILPIFVVRAHIMGGVLVLCMELQKRSAGVTWAAVSGIDNKSTDAVDFASASSSGGGGVQLRTRRAAQ